MCGHGQLCAGDPCMHGRGLVWSCCGPVRFLGCCLPPHHGRDSLAALVETRALFHNFTCFQLSHELITHEADSVHDHDIAEIAVCMLQGCFVDKAHDVQPDVRLRWRSAARTAAEHRHFRRDAACVPSLQVCSCACSRCSMLQSHAGAAAASPCKAAQRAARSFTRHALMPLSLQHTCAPACRNLPHIQVMNLK